MCIIVYKPKGIEFPKMSAINECWESNPHGAGVAWSNGKKTFLKKGFMTWDHLEMFLTQVKDELIDNDVVLHFRLATHGSIKPQNCHPFVVSNRIRDLRTLRYAGTDEIIAHNGIIPGIEFKTEKNDLSDTMLFTKKYHSLGKDNPEVQSILAQGKFVILTPEYTKVHGHFVKDFNCYFSNTSYKQVIYGTKRNIIAWEDWDDWEDPKATTVDLPYPSDPLSWQLCQYERTCLKDGYCVYSEKLIEDEIMEGDPSFCPLAQDYDLLDILDKGDTRTPSYRRNKYNWYDY